MILPLLKKRLHLQKKTSARRPILSSFAQIGRNHDGPSRKNISVSPYRAGGSPARLRERSRVSVCLNQDVSSSEYRNCRYSSIRISGSFRTTVFLRTIAKLVYMDSHRATHSRACDFVFRH